MTKIDLATFETFKEALLASVDSRARAIILSRPGSELWRMYQHALGAYALRRLQRPGRGYVSIELCAPDPSSPLPCWWKASLIWFEYNWRIGLEPPKRLQFSATLCDVDTGVESVEKVQASTSTRPPPHKLFAPLPKIEIGGCARSDSSLRPQ